MVWDWTEMPSIGSQQHDCEVRATSAQNRGASVDEALKPTGLAVLGTYTLLVSKEYEHIPWMRCTEWIDVICRSFRRFTFPNG